MPLIVWVILFLVAILRVPYCNNFIYNLDEAIVSMMARTILTGGMLYRDVAEHTPPVIAFLYAAMFKFFGMYNLAALHWLLTLIAVSITALVFIITRKLCGEKPAILACAAYAVAIYNGTSADLFAFQSSWVMTLFAMIALWLCLRGNFFISGLFFGLSLVSKPLTLFMFPVFMFLMIKGVRKNLFFLLGVFIVGAITISYFAYHRVLDDLYYYLVTASDKYVSAMPLPKRVWYFFKTPFWKGNILHYNSFVWYFGLVYTAWTFIKPTREKFFIFAWLAAAFFGASFSGRRFGHYFIFVLAPLSVMTGVLWNNFSLWLGERLKIRHAFALVLVFILLFYPVIHFGRPPWHATVASMEMLPAPNRVVRYLRENARPGDSLFVWGFLSEVYVKTGLIPASRHIHSNHLTGIMNGGNEKTPDISADQKPGAWKEWQEDMERSKPRWILDSSQAIKYYKRFAPIKFPELASYLKAHYRVAKIVRMNKNSFYRIYERK